MNNKKLITHAFLCLVTMLHITASCQSKEAEPFAPGRTVKITVVEGEIFTISLAEGDFAGLICRLNTDRSPESIKFIAKEESTPPPAGGLDEVYVTTYTFQALTADAAIIRCELLTHLGLARPIHFWPIHLLE